MSTLFLVFVFAVIMLLAAGIVRYLSPDYRLPALLGLTAWIAYGGILGYMGVIANSSTLPPGMFYLLAPIIMFVMFMARSRIGATVALSFPIWLLMGMESFRFVVEIFLHQLWIGGQVPKMLTYQGANFDILIGISAPIVAWLLFSRRISNQMALAWNVIGIVMLANVAARGVLTTPGPLHFISTEVPNVAIGTFPFTYIPGLMVPLALVLHVLSIRGLRLRMREVAPE
ncbi:MAG: hypothetical protein PHF31_00670 [Methylobacter sp.]|nr:hypothetical protein [Methylobacter sp.]